MQNPKNPNYLTPHLLTPCGRTRREFLWEAGGGFVASALTYLLARDGFFTMPLQANELATSSLQPKKSHFPGKAKRCIVLFMYGGPSQMDTWDPKPELNKHHGEPMPNLESDPQLKVRNPGTLLGTARKFTKFGKSGVEVSDLYPNLGKCVDDI